MEFGPVETLAFNTEMIEQYLLQFHQEETLLKRELENFLDNKVTEIDHLPWNSTMKHEELIRSIDFSRTAKNLMKIRLRQLGQQKLELKEKVDPSEWAKIKFLERQAVSQLLLIDNEKGTRRIELIEEQLLGFDISFGLKNLKKDAPIKVSKIPLIQLILTWSS